MSITDECSHVWKAPATVTYANGETRHTDGPHVCIKTLGHDTDPTDDDHKCCCGVNTWVTP